MRKNKIRFILSMLIITLVIQGFAQVPQAINYQAVARNSLGEAITNALIGVEISIHQGSITGTVVYKETHSALSNNIGIISFSIGAGAAVSGDFSQVSWGSDSYFVEVSVDINGGSNYIQVGTSQLLSVPYALYSAFSANVDDADADPENEIQCFSVSETGDTLYLSGCNYVIVPGISEANGGGGPGSQVADFDGNLYDIIVIGDQSWIKQSLRSEHDANGDVITEMYYYNDDPANAEVWGCLYTWEAVMNGSGSSNSNPSGVQGICPEGWHVPSHPEYEEMINFLGGVMGTGGKLKETGNTYWDEPNSGATNETQFSARGAGRRGTGGDYLYLKQQNLIWMATENNATSAYNLTLYSNQAGAMTHTNNKEMGFSVRCVKDE